MTGVSEVTVSEGAVGVPEGPQEILWVPEVAVGEGAGGVDRAVLDREVMPVIWPGLCLWVIWPGLCLWRSARCRR